MKWIGDPALTGSRCQSMHRSLLQIVERMYRNDGFEVTVCDQQPGLQILRAHNTTTAGPDTQIAVRIVTNVQKPGVILTEVEELLAAGPDVHLVVDSVDAATRLSEILRTPLQVVSGTACVCYNHPQPLVQVKSRTVFEEPTRWLVTAEKVPDTADPIVSLPIEEIRDLRKHLDLRPGSPGDLGLPRYEPQDDSHVVIKKGTTVDTFETRSEFQDVYWPVQLPIVPSRPRYDTAVTIRIIDSQTLTDYEHRSIETSVTAPESELSTPTACGSVQPETWSWIHLVRDSEIPAN